MPAKISAPISLNYMFSFLFMNIAHLYAKYRQKNKLLADYCDSSTMFICLCETFLHEGILDSEVQVPGFIIVSCPKLIPLQLNLPVISICKDHVNMANLAVTAFSLTHQCALNV